ncbi:hypothetical protein TPA0908_02760 [Micromonospora sp. AKA38]|nr:hypothetical protein TPA0908_02760 [Micromonospora sp. AKA38]
MLADTVAGLEREIRGAWELLLRELDVAPGSPEETELAWLVVDDPAAYDWRTVDGALDRLTCPASRARVGYELALPELVAGALPTTPQAQAAKALINRLADDECDRVASFAEVEALAKGR